MSFLEIVGLSFIVTIFIIIVIFIINHYNNRKIYRKFYKQNLLAGMTKDAAKKDAEERYKVYHITPRFL
jgi:hypothetical protein